MILNNIKKVYGNKSILENINYTFSSSGLYLVVGKSGVGKTTLLNIISGLDNDYNGQVLSRKKIFYFKSEFLISNFTVKENIEFIKDITKGFKLKKDNYGINELHRKRIDTLSGGEKQRVCFYISLCSCSKIILLDEPTSNLDYENKRKIASILKKESKNKLIIVVSHEKEMFDNYTLLEINNGKIDSQSSFEINNKYIQDNSEEKVNLSKWGFILIKKNFIYLLMFIISLFSLTVFIDSFKSELKEVEDAFDNSYSEGNLFYKENDFIINDDVFYKDVVIPLASEIYRYGSSIFSSDMYNHKVFFDSYYYGNGFLFSNMYEMDNLKEDEVVVSINSQKFCFNNKMEICSKENIREAIEGKQLKYVGEEEYHYKIKDIIEGDDGVYFSNPSGVKEKISKEYKEYKSRYYFVIENNKKEDYKRKIINIDSLLKYDFTEYYFDDHYSYYVVEKSEYKYFGYQELNDNNFVGCSDYGVSCTAFSFSVINSLYYIDDLNVKGKVKFEAFSDIGDKQVIISSYLSKISGHKKGDNIKLIYYIDDRVYIDELTVIGIEENNNIVIYKEAAYSYEFLYKLTGNVNRIKYAYGVEGDFSYKNLLYSDLINETKEIIKVFMGIANWIFYLIYIASIILLFLIEYKRNIKYKKMFLLLKVNLVKGGNRLFYIFYYMYLCLFVPLLFVNSILAFIYLLLTVIFCIISKRKIQVSLD
ncbi:MAG: ATP-binding cassette domain-containing protein [Bacilli bacterium]|nr:ATP-binding cassette domain-containing protein [Bacilli bacterium]